MPDLLEQLAPWGLLGSLALLGLWALMVVLELLVPLVQRDRRDLPVRKAPWALRVRQVR